MKCRTIFKKGYRALDVRLPEQFSLISKLRARYPVALLYHVFEVHRSSFKYWRCRPAEPDAERVRLRSMVRELHSSSHCSAGARSIAAMTTLTGRRMGHWLVRRLMKEAGLDSCQQPKHKYKRGGQEHVAIPNALDRQFAVEELNKI